MFPVVTVTPFSAARRFVVPAGATLNGYDPAKPGQVVLSQKFVVASSASAAATVGVAWQNLAGAPAPVPSGSPFLRVVDGTFKGLLIVAAQVTLDPEIPIAPDCSVAVAAATAPLNDALATARTTISTLNAGLNAANTKLAAIKTAGGF